MGQALFGDEPVFQAGSIVLSHPRRPAKGKAGVAAL
jgi:ribulose 1,5-bisphosphate carboxylase large subunit-like protein